PEQVAITIPARPDSAVNGRLRPGDAVQVLVTVADKARGEVHAHPVLDRAVVFEVGRDTSLASSAGTDTSDGSRGSIASVTLAVTTDQARKLAEARRRGCLEPPPSNGCSVGAARATRSHRGNPGAATAGRTLATAIRAGTGGRCRCGLHCSRAPGRATRHASSHPTEASDAADPAQT